MQKVRSPVLVMHGDMDTVIPIGLGRALFERIPGPKRFVTIAGGDHNDLTPRDAEAYLGGCRRVHRRRMMVALLEIVVSMDILNHTGVQS